MNINDPLYCLRVAYSRTFADDANIILGAFSEPTLAINSRTEQPRVMYIIIVKSRQELNMQRDGYQTR